VNQGRLKNKVPVNEFSTVISAMTFSSFKLRDCLQSRHQTSSSSTSSAIDCVTLNEFGESIIPLLIDSWVEASPTDINLSRGQKSVSNEVFDLYASIVSLLKLLLDLSALLHSQTELSLRSTFSKRFLPELAKRFCPFFPLQAPHHRKSSSTSFSSSFITATPIFVNLVICDVLTFDNRVLLKDHPPAWVQTVFDHLAAFFSSSNLIQAVDSDLTLAFSVVRRCLKSPVFVAKSLKKIFAQVTSNFFQLSIDPQLMFLDFFFEFLVEFSSLLSHGDEFLSDLKIRSWLENLPAYLKSLIKSSSSDHASDHASDESPESISTSLSALASRIFGLFSSASSMKLGAFFPLRLFFGEMLTKDTFPHFNQDLKRRLLTLAGQVDLGDEKLLSHFAEFLAADFHQSHDFLAEMVLFNQSENASDDSHRRVVVLLTAALTKKSYDEVDSLTEKRVGSYFVRAGFDGTPLELGTFLEQPGVFQSNFKVNHFSSLLSAPC